MENIQRSWEIHSLVLYLKKKKEIPVDKSNLTTKVIDITEHKTFDKNTKESKDLYKNYDLFFILD